MSGVSNSSSETILHSQKNTTRITRTSSGYYYNYSTNVAPPYLATIYNSITVPTNQQCNAYTTASYTDQYTRQALCPSGMTLIRTYPELEEIIVEQDIAVPESKGGQYNNGVVYGYSSKYYENTLYNTGTTSNFQKPSITGNQYYTAAIANGTYQGGSIYKYKSYINQVYLNSGYRKYGRYISVTAESYDGYDYDLRALTKTDTESYESTAKKANTDTQIAANYGQSLGGLKRWYAWHDESYTYLQNKNIAEADYEKTSWIDDDAVAFVPSGGSKTTYRKISGSNDFGKKVDSVTYITKFDNRWTQGDRIGYAYTKSKEYSFIRTEKELFYDAYTAKISDNGGGYYRTLYTSKSNQTTSNKFYVWIGSNPDDRLFDSWSGKARATFEIWTGYSKDDFDAKVQRKSGTYTGYTYTPTNKYKSRININTEGYEYTSTYKYNYSTEYYTEPYTYVSRSTENTTHTVAVVKQLTTVYKTESRYTLQFSSVEELIENIQLSTYTTRNTYSILYYQNNVNI